MNRVYIVAEIGNTHEGSLGLAKQFIKAAAATGVDAVKFQTHIFEAESLPSAPNPPYFKDETRKEYFERTAFNKAQYEELLRYAKEDCGVDFFSSPFSIAAVELLYSIGIRTFKIPSGEVSNLPLLEYIASLDDCKVILSSGMSSWSELDEAVKVLQSNCDLTVLQCTSEYPCLPENAGLNVMLQIKDRYNCKVGFSDHTLGIGVPVTAVALGAVFIEKHFTLSKLMYGSDAKNSTEPLEFELLVKSIRAAENAISFKIDKDKKVADLIDMKVTFEKSIVAKTDLDEGHIITFNDLDFKKPGNGIPARLYKDLIGRKLIKSINYNDLFSFEHFNQV